MSYKSDFFKVIFSTVSLVTVILPFSSTSPLSTAISSVESALRASPLANSAIMVIISGDMSTSCPPKPRPSFMARLKRPASSSVFNACSTNTLQRERSAPFTSNEGFSVVAPMSIMLPFSTNGRKASCCALLKRCISSTKSMVFAPNLRPFSACSITCFISFMPLVTAEKSIKLALVRLAIMRASVVLPTPGGPQNIMEPILSLSIILRSTLPSPKRCFCPTNSSSVLGLRRAASGRLLSSSKNVGCSYINLYPAAGAWRCCTRPRQTFVYIIPHDAKISSAMRHFV